jgi:hypothetical protein
MELAALITAELAVEGAQVIVTPEPTVGWTATVTGAASRPFIAQLKADDIAARLRRTFDLQPDREMHYAVVIGYPQQEPPMPNPMMRTKLTEAELQAVIMERLTKEAECAAITQIYVRPIGLKPPEETWMHSLVSRHVNAPRRAKEADAMLKVIAALRLEYDLVRTEEWGRLRT